jgi:dUTP pyrophosphatase
MDKNLQIKIKYFNDEMPRLTYIEGKSNWIDLMANEDIELKQGEFALVSLGVAMQLPDGYEAYMLPRSSSFKNYGFLQTNSQGVIDTSYCGDSDEWKLPVLAIRDVVIKKFDRVCQFRIQKSMPEFEFIQVETLGNKDRDGFGSTGKQ